MFRGVLGFWMWTSNDFVPPPIVSHNHGMLMVHGGYLRHRQYRQKEHTYGV